MGKLKGQIAYLAGPIDDCKDRGKSWRILVDSCLRTYGVGILNPLDKSTINNPALNEDEKFVLFRKELIEKKQYDKLHETMKEIVRADLAMVDAAHFLIVLVDKECHMCGTYHELIVASQQKKPCLVVCKQGKDNMPPWLYGILPHERFFSTFNEMLEYLDNIDDGTINDRGWRFFNMDKIYAD